MFHRPTLCCIALASSLALASCSKPAPRTYAVEEVPLAQVSADLAAGKTTSAAVTQAYIDRIKTYNGALNAVIAIMPDALDQARASDKRRAEGKALGPLDGVPVLLKDNIDATGAPTTSGSFALAENVPARDSEAARRLRAAGAVILGKTNLSQWAGYRTTDSFAGSTVGGTPHNPYDLTKSAAGSSSGSGIAMAASLAAGAFGTDTGGSITGPATANGVVGLRPTTGLISRRGVVPNTSAQDTIGPMARTVTDVAMLLNAVAGSDPADPRTADADAHKTDYVKALNAGALKGARIGVLRGMQGDTEKTRPLFDAALAVMKAQGAELIDLPDGKTLEDINPEALTAEAWNFKHDIAQYLADAPAAVKPRSVEDLIAFAKNDPRESKIGMQYWEEAAAAQGGFDNPEYQKLMEFIRRKAGPEGFGGLISQYNLDAFVVPARGPAETIPPDGTPRPGGRTKGTPSYTWYAAVGGYPLLSVPMGSIDGLPVDISFLGPQWSEQNLLSYAYAYAQAGYKRIPPQAYKAAAAAEK
jgi:amidase